MPEYIISNMVSDIQYGGIIYSVFPSGRSKMVFNSPQALRNQPEKLSILEFPEYIAPTLVTRNPQHVRDFHAQYRDIICKPLDGMGGTSIFRHRVGDPNLSVILETLTANGTQQIMAQGYLPGIKDGDKRILMIDGEPVPYCLARIPAQGETRGNLAAGGRGVAMPLTDGERAIADHLAPILWSRGLLIVGLDVIGDRLTEINVTSPTCMVEITAQSGFDVPGAVIDALEQACT